MAKQLIQSLAGSQIYQEYERAFSTATGLPLALRSIEAWQLPHHGQKLENPFCALISKSNAACAACLQVQQELAAAAVHAPQTVTCMVGLSETAVPVQVGGRLAGFLSTGQVFRRKPSAAQFKRTVQLVKEWGVPVSAKELRRIYFGARVLSAKEMKSIIRLLAIFAQHLALMSNQIVTQEECLELPLINRAKAYIAEHLAEPITLTQVAEAVNTSRFNFCKQFKKATGMHFTSYVTRMRLEKAKNLLLNPNLRISEIAYESGFQSLTNFNRIFKRIQGISPTEFREQLAQGWADGVA
jgi:AraC-like DNA-binding protein/ligand-binding sensor protein